MATRYTRRRLMPDAASDDRIAYAMGHELVSYADVDEAAAARAAR